MNPISINLVDCENIFKIKNEAYLKGEESL
jgi:hypothetical protein